MSESRRRLHSLVRPFSPEEDTAAGRLRLALDLMAAGMEMKRMSLQRTYPQESGEEIAGRLVHWAQDQPAGAGLRDASYRTRPLH